METQWNFSNALYDAMEAEEYDAQEIAQCAREEHCTYVVLSSVKPMKGSMEEQNYIYKGLVSGYYIYMDYNYYEVLRDQICWMKKIFCLRTGQDNEHVHDLCPSAFIAKTMC
ncbi:MAG: hypothetical protein ACLTFZ_10535 [Lachnospiraceae bacterium]